MSITVSFYVVVFLCMYCGHVYTTALSVLCLVFQELIDMELKHQLTFNHCGSTTNMFPINLQSATFDAHSCGLFFRDINVDVNEKRILWSVSGYAKPGRILALMGPSGKFDED